MSYTGAGVEVAIVPNSNTFGLHTAESIGATHGFYPLSISAANQRGENFIFDSIGNSGGTIFKRIMESTQITITTHLRWNGPEWAFLANIVGDATKSGTSFPVTNTFNYQDDPLPALTYPAITVVYRINSDNDLIIEKPNCVVSNFTFTQYDGFLGASITLMDDTTLTGSNATNGGTEFTALTYNATDSQCIYFKGMDFFLNGQAAGDPSSGTILQDVADWSWSISRSYDPMEDVLKGYNNATGTDAVRRAQPLWDGNYFESILSFRRKTMPDAHINDLIGEVEYKAESRFSEDVGGNTHTLVSELGRLVYNDHNMDIERALRLGQQLNFRLLRPSSTPTGFATANPFHIIHTGSQNWTFETLAA